MFWQVMHDHKRAGVVSFLEVAAIPVQFRCWLQLLLAQIMLPDAGVSFTGHLCGIFAGLLHVYLPKAGMPLPSHFVWPLNVHGYGTVSSLVLSANL